MSWNSIWTNNPPWDKTGIYAEANAEEIYDLLINTYGWTYNAVMACLGNLSWESSLNPGQWQYGYSYPNWSPTSDTGFGLGQWTPAYKVSAYCGSTQQGVVDDGAMQVEFLDSQSGQWSTYFVNSDGSSTYYEKSAGEIAYYATFDDFKHGTDDIYKMTLAYACCWERPNKTYLAEQQRNTLTSHWNDHFGGISYYRITKHKTGNGTVAVSETQATEGTLITLICDPAVSESIVSITSTPDVGLTNQQVQYFYMPSSNVDIYVEFTSVVPPTPPTHSNKMPLYMMLRRRPK